MFHLWNMGIPLLQHLFIYRGVKIVQQVKEFRKFNVNFRVLYNPAKTVIRAIFHIESISGNYEP